MRIAKPHRKAWRGASVQSNQMRRGGKLASRIGWAGAVLFSVLGVAISSAGCFTTRYVTQAAVGQLRLQSRAKPIRKLLADPKTPPKLKALLAHVQPTKTFANYVGLTPAGSYNAYAELDRDAAVWLVTACPALSFEPKTWSFPLVGSFPYVGWFAREDAEELARQLEGAGWDVHVRGASAYSTLGWFKDPILSTMISRSPSAIGDLVESILHESAHATVFVPNQSVFNESVATFLGEELAPVYLAWILGPEAASTVAYLDERRRRRERHALLAETYARLEALYRADTSSAEKLGHKDQILAAARRALGSRSHINNASLIGFRTYHAGTESLQEMWMACGRDVRAVVAALRRVEASWFEAPQQEELGAVVRRAAREGCSASRLVKR